MGTTFTPYAEILALTGRDTSPVVTDRSTDLASDQPVKLLNRKNPEYEARREAWLDLALLYEGGSSLKARGERLLKKRPREDEEVFSARLDHLTYQNILGTALGWYGAAMFETPPEFEFEKGTDEAFFKKFLTNSDGVGTDFLNIFKNVFQVLLNYGCAWVLTDLEAVDVEAPEPTSLEDQRARGLLDPHIVVYNPLQVINWKTDSLGRFEYVVVKTEVIVQEFLKPEQRVTTWYYYDQKRYYIYEDRVKLDDSPKLGNQDESRQAKFLRSGFHGLSEQNRVPVRRLELTDGLWLANRAYLQLVDHINQDNTLKWALFMSNLAIPVIIGNVDPGGITNSETGFLHFPEGTEYTWSEPAGNSFVQSAARVESLREEIFRSLSLTAQGRSMRATPAMQSGKSKLLEMAPSKQILSGMGADVRRAMQLVLTDVGEARRDTGVVPTVRGFIFQDDMSTEEVFAVTSLISLNVPSEKFEKYIYRKMAKSWMTDANREEIEEVYKEINEAASLKERQEDDLKMRAKIAGDAMKSKLKTPGPTKPPGRGGDGPAVSSKD